MPSLPVDYVKVLTQTIGSGIMVLGDPAPGGFRGVEALVDGATYSYSLAQPTGEYEVGRGVFDASLNTLTRDPLWSSRTNNNSIALTGLGVVSFTILAEDLIAYITGGGTFIFGSSNDALSGTVSLAFGYNGFVNLSGGVLVCNLPANPTDGDQVILQDEFYSSDDPSARGAGTFEFRMTPASGMISGGAYLALNITGGSVTVRYSAMRSQWILVP